MRLLLPLLLLTHLLAAKDSLTVYLFLLDECRISQEMTPYINEIYSRYKTQAGFIGAFPNKATHKDNMQAFAAKYSIRFPLVLDHEKVLAKRWKATILPEVVLYNERTQQIVYRGLINDLYLKPGKRRYFIKNHYLASALEAALAGREVSVKETRPVGCFINFQENSND